MDSRQQVRAVATFLNTIGLVTIEEIGARGFVPGVNIREGVIAIDPTEAKASDLLHEAGHLATVPGCFRHFFSGNVDSGQRRSLEALNEIEAEIDSPVFRAVMQCSDPEATAWAWAVGKYLGIREKDIIEDEDYNGEGEGIRTMLSLNSYVGINGLAHAGFCSIRERSVAINGLPAYPKLAMWVQPDNPSLHV